jgi:hypothetical protein
MSGPSIEGYISSSSGGGAPLRRLRCLLRSPGFTGRSCPTATATRRSDRQFGTRPPIRFAPVSLGRWARLACYTTVAVVVVGCAHSNAGVRALPPLAPASATIAAIDASQQVVHGQPCPAGFISSELPGDWCYRLGETILRPTDFVGKSVYLDPNQVRWVIAISLRSEAAKRFVTFDNTHDDHNLAIVVAGSVVATLPVNRSLTPASQFWTLDGPWTEQQARRIGGALGGVASANPAGMPPKPTFPVGIPVPGTAP